MQASSFVCAPSSRSYWSKHTGCHSHDGEARDVEGVSEHRSYASAELEIRPVESDNHDPLVRLAVSRSAPTAPASPSRDWHVGAAIVAVCAVRGGPPAAVAT
eukprot:COSAG02_NODE_1419_length_12701_cov_20.731551_8_plen_102_part_00